MKNRNKQTKFPVARIKKIMQKDEEVGKVAQATPVVISKALELFLGLLVDSASKVTLERGSKRVEAYHLKHAIEHTDMLDFLKEIVDSVPDPSAGGTIDIEAEKAEAKKRRGTQSRRDDQGEDSNNTTTTTQRKRRKKSEAGLGKGVEVDLGVTEGIGADEREADHGDRSGGGRWIHETGDSSSHNDNGNGRDDWKRYKFYNPDDQ